MLITAKNALHNTTVTVRPNGNRLSIGQAAKVRRELCGMKDCSCRIISSAHDENGQRVGIEFHPLSVRGGAEVVAY